MFDAFISYGRTDSKAFAVKLYERLHKQGYKVWFDQNDIPLAVDFQNQINDGLAQSHNFLFIISPHAVNSGYCLKEIELALKYNKRVIPLLHVEEIERDIWQQRNPQGTDADWQIYCQRGYNSSFPNIHPVIGKINWIYFREGVDNFEESFQGLVTIFSRHQDYVHQHTYLLLKTLKWKAHQQENPYLLTEGERLQAEAWLKTQFQGEQPPCEPTDWQCEYICESEKNANNWMSKVFLCYTTADRSVMEKIRTTLMRHSFSIWTNRTDIRTGAQFSREIQKGIEKSDNLVYLLSANSLTSDYCQQELQQAKELHKRIIPLLIEPLNLETIPAEILAWQFLDFTEHHNPHEYRQSSDSLINILNQDALYYTEHKLLLVKALKWEQQNHNPSILLRGHSLNSAQSWLKIAQQHPYYPPTSLQLEFIAASQAQPPDQSLDVFISYSRADGDLARKLNNSLQTQGKTTWFDQESIPPGEDFLKEIHHGIETSDNFLFIISPDSINSPHCADEIQYARSLHKRFITMLYRSVDIVTVPPALATIEWIDCQSPESDQYYRSFSELIRTLELDREHVKSHTKWWQRANDWEKFTSQNEGLLQGRELAIAQQWLIEAERGDKKPSPTKLHHFFIKKSRQLEEATAERKRKEQEQILNLQKERAKEAEARLEAEKQSARRLKFTLMAVMVGLVATTIGIMGFWLESQRATRNENVIRGVNQAIAKGTSQEVVRIFSEVQATLEFTQQVFTNQLIPLDNPQKREAFLFNLLETRPNLTWIEFGFPNGNYFGVQREKDQDREQTLRLNIINRLWNPQTKIATKTIVSYPIIGKNFLPKIEKIEEEQYNATQRDWYHIAEQNPYQISWTTAYIFRTSKTPGISASLLMENAGQRLGVISIALELQQISDYLRQLQENQKGAIFLVNKKGELIAFSDSQQDEDEPEKDAEGKLKLQRLENANNQNLKLANQVLKINELSLEKIANNQVAQTQYIYRNPETNEPYYISFSPLQYPQDFKLRNAHYPRWIVGTVIPESIYVQEINQNQKRLFYVISGVLFVATGFTIFIALK